jgi:hypothetical protein
MSGKNENEVNNGDVSMEVGTKRRGRGRPKKSENRWDRAFRFNGSDEHMHMKEALEDELDMNGGEVMREALELLYNMKIGWRR